MDLYEAGQHAHRSKFHGHGHRLSGTGSLLQGPPSRPPLVEETRRDNLVLNEITLVRLERISSKKWAGRISTGMLSVAGQAAEDPCTSMIEEEDKKRDGRACPIITWKMQFKNKSNLRRTALVSVIFVEDPGGARALNMETAWQVLRRHQSLFFSIFRSFCSCQAIKLQLFQATLAATVPLRRFPTNCCESSDSG